jgi:predicted nucleotidyltransferase
VLPSRAIAHREPNELARTAAIDFARRLARHWQEALGTELLGAYIIGSAAHGGFNSRYSDLDIALVTATGLSPQALDRLRSEAVVLSVDWGSKVSVFWTIVTFLSADFRRWIASIISITRSRCGSASASGRHGPRWKMFGITCAAHHLRTGQMVRGTSRLPKGLSRRIAKHICGRFSILGGFATVG